MNLFFLNIDPKKCAEEHCDKHVVKMVLEIVQMLYTAHHLHGNPPDFAYRISHVKHPISIWIRLCYANYSYAVQVAKYLSIEYTYRYDKIHSCQKHIEWLLINVPKFNTNLCLSDTNTNLCHSDTNTNLRYSSTTILSYNKDFESMGMTPVPLAMPIECKLSDPILSYRKYYIMKKQYFARWTSRPIPRWYTPVNTINITKYFTKIN